MGPSGQHSFDSEICLHFVVVLVHYGHGPIEIQEKHTTPRNQSPLSICDFSRMQIHDVFEWIRIPQLRNTHREKPLCRTAHTVVQTQACVSRLRSISARWETPRPIP